MKENEKYLQQHSKEKVRIKATVWRMKCWET
jgi:hypothetical protein